MVPGPHHEISNLEISSGELSFEATIDGLKRRIWFRTETEVEPYPEAALAAALMPAMRSGGRLTMSEPVSPRVLRMQREFQGVQRAWSRDWVFGEPPLREVEVKAAARPAERRPLTGRVAVFFSGGVDSWSTLLGEDEITDLIFVRGLDILPRFAHQGDLADRVEERLRGAAEEMGLPLHVVETNVRELSELKGPEQPLVHWEAYYASTLSAVALFLGPLFDRVLISTTGVPYEDQPPIGGSWMVDQLWGNESLEIVDAGGLLGRAERIERIAGHPVVQKSLRVCWQNPDGAYNCGRCRKCLVTMANLEALGLLDRFQTFPPRLDEEQLELLGAQEVQELFHLTMCEEALAAIRRNDKPELERALGRLVSQGKRKLGLPPGYHSRHVSPPAAEGQDSGARLLATPETARAIAVAPAVAFLVGGYDGSGNYGDAALLDAALGMLGESKGRLLTLPVLERQYAATHRELRGDLLHEPQHVLYFDDGGDFEDDLAPLPAIEPGFALSYLYGGGFLNPSWGERKLAMLRAVERAAQGAGAVTRIASGLQVDPGWIDRLGDADTRLLASFELLGARDDTSAAALERLAGADPVTNTGDDAVGLLAGIRGGGAGDGGENLMVNVHIAEHPWVTDRPDSVRDFAVALLAELARLAGRPLRVRPLLAYLDPRVDERPGLERFAAACAERGIEVGEPLVMNPAGVAGIAPRLREAVLTVSCSFHVALTSLLLATPAVLLRDNPYYDQKAAGLLADFGLPESFSPSSDDDPLRCAAAIAAAVLEGGGGPFGERLREAGGEVRLRRARAEAELLARVARGSIAAAGSPNRPEEAAQPHLLEQQVAEAARRVEETERREAEAWARLEEALGSHSWRVTAPLRRFAAYRRGR